MLFRIALMMVARKPGSPGRARSKPLKPLRRKRRTQRLNLWWLCSYAFSFRIRGCGCSSAPGVSCALCFRRERLWTTRARWRRERVDACSSSFRGAR